MIKRVSVFILVCMFLVSCTHDSVDMQSEIQRLEEEVKNLEDSYEELLAIKSQQDKRIEHLEEVNRNDDKDVKEIYNERDSLLEEVDKLNNELVELNKDLEISIEKIDELNEIVYEFENSYENISNDDEMLFIKVINEGYDYENYELEVIKLLMNYNLIITNYFMTTPFEFTKDSTRKFEEVSELNDYMQINQYGIVSYDDIYSRWTEVITEDFAIRLNEQKKMYIEYDGSLYASVHSGGNSVGYKFEDMLFLSSEILNDSIIIECLIPLATEVKYYENIAGMSEVLLYDREFEKFTAIFTQSNEGLLLDDVYRDDSTHICIFQ